MLFERLARCRWGRIHSLACPVALRHLPRDYGTSLHPWCRSDGLVIPYAATKYPDLN